MFANAFSFLGVPLTRDLSEADVTCSACPMIWVQRVGRVVVMGLWVSAMLRLICVGRRNVGLGPLMLLTT